MDKGTILDHPERGPMRPWNFVNGYMGDERFREYVLRTAWIHRAKAPKALRNFAEKAMTKNLRAPGFRPGSKGILSCAFSSIKDSLNHSMWAYPDVSAALVALWADAENELVNELRMAAINSGISLTASWSWKSGVVGFLEMDNIEDLLSLAREISSPEDEFIKWKYYLAAVWLSGALIVDIDVQSSQRDDNLTSEHIDEKHLEDVMNGNQPETNLSALHQQLSEQIAEIDNTYQNAQNQLNAIYEVFGAEPTANLIQQTINLRDQLVAYHDEETGLIGSINQAIEALHYYLTERLDLITDFPVLLDNIEQNTLSPTRIAQELLEIIESIADYDSERSSVLLQYQKLSDQVTNLKLQLSDEEGDSQFDEGESPNEISTLTQAKSGLNILQKLYQSLQRRVTLKQQSLIEQIIKLTTLLETEEDLPPLEGFVWDELNETYLSNFPVGRLQNILSQLAQIHEQWLQKQRNDRVTTIDASGEFDSVSFKQALEELASQGLDVEVLLLLLCGYSAQNAPFELELNDIVVDAMIKGVNQFADSETKFDVFNWLAPVLLTRWTTDDPISCAKIQLMLLGAEYSSVPLSEGVIWQFPNQQWALDDTPNWKHVWEAVLFGEAIPEFMDDHIHEDMLQAKQKAIEQSLIKENGRYSRAGTVKSARHSAMLANYLLPGLEQSFAELLKIKQQLLEIPEDQLEWRWTQLKNEIEKICSSFTEDNLLSHYEDQVNQEGIRDNNPFLREKTIKFYFDIAKKIKDYATDLLKFGDLQVVQLRQISRHKLISEIDKYSNLIDLAVEVIEHLDVEKTEFDKQPHTGEEATQKAIQKIVSVLLLEGKYATRMPHLLALLTRTESGIDDWLQPLLEDITQERDVKGSFEILMEAYAANQALLISEIPVELQNRAQELQGKLVQNVIHLETKLMQLDGEIEDLRVSHKLGRWVWLEKVLEKRIKENEETLKAAEEDLKQQRTTLWTRVSTLKTKVFSDDAIPQDIKQRVLSGLSTVEQAALQHSTSDGIFDFLKDLEYRLDHKAWAISEIETSITRLQADLEGKSSISRTELTAEKVLDLLNRREITQLGFSENQIVLSNVETRCTVLENWLQLRNCNAFHTTEMSNKDRQAVDSLYRAFAKMVAMQQVLTPSGDPIKDDNITPFSLYELRYPKTSVLDIATVFISLPGTKPKAKHRQAIQEIIAGREWIPERFIIIFIPGCTSELKTTLYNRESVHYCPCQSEHTEAKIAAIKQGWTRWQSTTKAENGSYRRCWPENLIRKHW